MRIRIHFNRRRASAGLPWTLHTSRACHSASHVEILVPAETEERPDRASNPRYFILAHGQIRWSGTVAQVVPA